MKSASDCSLWGGYPCLDWLSFGVDLTSPRMLSVSCVLDYFLVVSFCFLRRRKRKRMGRGHVCFPLCILGASMVPACRLSNALHES